MTTKIKSIMVTWDRDAFGIDVEREVKRFGLTGQDLDEMIGKMVYRSITHPSLTGYMPTMRTYLAVCNLLDLNPTKYFKLDL